MITSIVQLGAGLTSVAVNTAPIHLTTVGRLGGQIAYNTLSGLPTLGTAAANNIPATGNASATEVVYGSDTRLSDARTPASHTTGSHSDWPAGVSTTELGYLDGVTSALQTQMDGKLIGRSTNITVTVGSGGDYATINAALAALSKYYPLYVANGFTATINLLTGFVMNEQVIVNNGVDLGWITITGADASTNLSSTIFDGASYYVDVYDNRNFCGAFEAHNNSILPIINQTFIGVETTTGTPAIYTGLIVSKGSKGIISPGVGFSGFDLCVFSTDGGIVYAHDAIFAGGDLPTGGGVLAYGGNLYAPGISIDGGWVGVSARHGAIVSCPYSTIVNCSYNIAVARQSIGDFGWADLTSALVTGILCNSASIFAFNVSARAGVIDSSTDVVVQNGGIITFTGSVTGGISVTKNTLTTSGIIFAD